MSIYLFGVLRRFQHCTGHITTGSWKGRGNQYIGFARILYCKLPTNMLSMEITELGRITYNQITCRVHTSTKSKVIFLFPDDNPDHSKNLMGCKVDISSDFFSGISNSYYLQYPTNVQADKETNRQF